MTTNKDEIEARLSHLEDEASGMSGMEMFTQMRTLLRSYERGLLAIDGVVVPREPTVEMLEASMDVGGEDESADYFENVYKAMIASSPGEKDAPVSPTPEMKPCPFCDGAINLTEEDDPQFYFECQTCGHVFNHYAASLEGAIAMMNTRVSVPKAVRETIQFYADHANYFDAELSNVQTDEGHRARDVLRMLDGEGG